MAMVARAAALTATPEVDKVVLSRLIDITTRERVDSGALLERLIAQNPASFNFHVPLSDGGVLLGASPELLLRKEGAHFSSLPLAGSAVASRTMCWIAKRATGCWPRKRSPRARAGDPGDEGVLAPRSNCRCRIRRS
jgi:hypothetical protein